MAAWRHWYHVIGTTYGTWLHGDKRGWRSRHHRQHVDGDYKAPPAPGKYDKLAEHARRQMKKPAVHLTKPQQRIACLAMAEYLGQLNIEVLAVSQDHEHYHILARFPGDDPKPLVGLAKREATRRLARGGFTGRTWAKGSGPKAIQNRQHQLRVFGYIREHREQGAVVWDFRDGLA